MLGQLVVGFYLSTGTDGCESSFFSLACCRKQCLIQVSGWDKTAPGSELEPVYVREKPLVSLKKKKKKSKQTKNPFLIFVSEVSMGNMTKKGRKSGSLILSP